MLLAYATKKINSHPKFWSRVMPKLRAFYWTITYKVMVWNRTTYIIKNFKNFRSGAPLWIALSVCLYVCMYVCLYVWMSVCYTFFETLIFYNLYIIQICLKNIKSLYIGQDVFSILIYIFPVKFVGPHNFFSAYKVLDGGIW